MKKVILIIICIIGGLYLIGTIFMLLIGTLVFNNILDPCKNPKYSVEYEGVLYCEEKTVSLAFGKDTISGKIYYHPFGLEGDNMRVFRLFTKKDTTIFPLPNSLEGYTQLTCYSINVGKKRYLWFEDNFGSVALDIDNKKLAKVNSPLKEKIHLLPNGASHGERGIISERYFRKQLSLSKDTRVRILDSLQIEY